MTLPVPLTVRLKTGSTDRHVKVRRIAYSLGVSGGFRACTIELDRSLSITHDEITQYGSLFVYDGRNARTLWQGRMEDPGRGAGPEGEIWTITAVGPSAHARERTVPLIYVDRSLDRWFITAGGSLGYRNVQTGKEGQDAGGLTFAMGEGDNFTDNLAVYFRYSALREADQKLARVSATWDVNNTDTDYAVELRVVDIGGSASSVTTAAWNTAGGTLTGTKQSNWSGADRYDADLGIKANGVNPPAIPNSNYNAIFEDIVIRSILKNASGSDITTGYTQNYVLAHEVVNDLLGRILTKFAGADASVATNAFQIDQFAFPDGVTAADLLDELVAIHPDHFWAAWEGDPARFEWAQWPTSVRYDASTRDGFESPATGAEIYNAVNVRWRAPSGKIRNTRRTQTVALLDDAGLTREAHLDVGDNVSSSSLAQRVGDQFLAEHKQAPNRGVLTVRTPIFDRVWARIVQPWEILPGTLIRVRDVLPRVGPLNATDRDAVTVFRVISVDYDSGGNVATLELDATPNRLERMLARRKVARRR